MSAANPFQCLVGDCSFAFAKAEAWIEHHLRVHPSDDLVPKGYGRLQIVLVHALQQAASGKGKERHAHDGEAFEDQQIIQLAEWMGNGGFPIGQACKKALESTRLPYEGARRELLGAIVYLAAEVIRLDRKAGK